MASFARKEVPSSSAPLGRLHYQNKGANAGASRRTREGVPADQDVEDRSRSVPAKSKVPFKRESAVPSAPAAESATSMWMRENFAFRPASHQSADTGGNLGQIVVELVIAAAEPMNERAGDRSLIKINMPNRRSVVLAAVIEMDRRLGRQ